MSNDKPLGSALAMSMALSLKASALFYIPVFLGLIQYKYGIKTLIKATIVILLW
jgi:predicted membrane-bound dolichyl-phosphate-mannose-protein mannosyltransferase